MKGSVMPPRSVTSGTIKWISRKYPENNRDIIRRTYEIYRELDRISPDYGGRSAPHSVSIYGSIWIFALCDSLREIVGEMPPDDEFQEFLYTLFMSAFKKFGRIIDLNRPKDMALADRVFRQVSAKDKKFAEKNDTGFENHRGSPVHDKDDPSVIRATRYKFTRCPVAEFAKEHGYTDILPFMCNCDHYGIEQLNGKLIRRSTCGIGNECDYLIVGDKDPAADRFELVRHGSGTLISVKKQSG